MTTKAGAQLIKLDEYKRGLAKIASVDEAKKIRDYAEALRNYAKQQSLGLEVQNKAAEIKIRAERRGGEILVEIQRKPGKRIDTSSHDATRYEQACKIVGGRWIAHRWQEEASIPEPVFNEFVAIAKANKEELTSAATRRFARETSTDPATRARRAAAKAPTIIFNKEISKLDVMAEFFIRTAKEVHPGDKQNLIAVLDRILSIIKKIRRSL